MKMEIKVQQLYAFDKEDYTILYYILPKLHYQVVDNEGWIDILFYHPIMNDEKIFRNSIQKEELDVSKFRIATDKEREKFDKLRSNDPEVARISIEFLNRKAKELTLKRWGVNFTSSVKEHNKRDRSILGYAYFEARLNGIFFTEESLELHSEEEIVDMLIHELCHWYLFSIGEDWTDCDVRFAQELIKQGVGHTHNSNNELAARAYKEAQMSD
ncbi:hypothetical protein P4U85_18040 [Brevibacillus laterosporus]|nr:hypothetical protein [Brevibacillus laterosporus]MED1667172.1 hypothetical protein [Brevibacillus laterosporus]MED1719760.1 hypothetical protein [Brevibacillus laterosporus]